MRALVFKTTLLLAVLAALTVAALDLSAGTSWIAATTRAVLGFAIVSAAGCVVGLILMRTALRRWYEEWRLARTQSRARAGR